LIKKHNMNNNLPYRKSVGIVLFNKAGLVWIGKRVINTNIAYSEGSSWQFPQGGVNKNEDLESAARRELYEETCIKNVEFLGKSSEPLFYDFPKELQNLAIAKTYKGQKQYWFACLFTGEDKEISVDNIPNGSHIEFSEWRWEEFSESINLVVDFKKSTYKKLYDIFKKYELQLKAATI